MCHSEEMKDREARRMIAPRSRASSDPQGGDSHQGTQELAFSLGVAMAEKDFLITNFINT